MSPNLIFLDIDGVLNSHRSILMYGKFGFPCKGEELRRMTKAQARSRLCLDDYAVRALRVVTETTNAQIVISSTWRMGSTIDDFVMMFLHYDWDSAPVIGMTPCTAKGFRGEEIMMFLKNYPDSNYVIIDDDSDLHPDQKSHFVHTSMKEGLGFSDMERAITILTSKTGTDLQTAIFNSIRKICGKSAE